MAKKKKKNKLKRKTLRKAKDLKTSVSSIFSIPNKIVNFLKAVKSELKLVEWLNLKETTKWSSAVILTALLIGGMIVLLDLAFYNLRSLLFSINV